MKNVVSYVPLSFEEIKNLRSSHVQALNWQGREITLKINGAVKLWKTRKFDLDLPFKYGMYEYGYISFRNGVQTDGPVICNVVPARFQVIQQGNLRILDTLTKNEILLDIPATSRSYNKLTKQLAEMEHDEIMSLYFTLKVS